MMKAKYSKYVIVTGATGFIGCKLIPLLIKRNYNVLAISRNPEKVSNLAWFKQVKFLKYDLKKKQKKIKFNKNAGLIHLAWEGLPNYKSNFHIKYNLPNSYKFIKSLIFSGLKKALITGTCAEYGMVSGPIASKNKTFPFTSYAIAKDKLRIKLMTLKNKKKYKLQWPRIFFVYDKERQSQNSLIGKLNIAIDNKQKVFNLSGGEQVRDYLSVEKVAKSIMDLYESNKTGVKNICSGKPIAVKRLVKNHIKKRKSNISLNFGYYPYSDIEPMKFWGIPDKKF